MDKATQAYLEMMALLRAEYVKESFKLLVEEGLRVPDQDRGQLVRDADHLMEEQRILQRDYARGMAAIEAWMDDNCANPIHIYVEEAVGFGDAISSTLLVTVFETQAGNQTPTFANWMEVLR